MPDLARLVFAEPSAASPRHYTARVRWLAAIYATLFLVSAGGIVVLVWKARVLVLLTQRSNVETLTLAFFLIFFAYVGVLSSTGALGAARLAAWALLGAPSRDRHAAERRKMRALGDKEGRSEAALNVVLARAGRTGEPLELPVADEIGDMGVLRVDGARITHESAHRRGSNNLFGFFTRQVNEILEARGAKPRSEVEVVDWKKINDEATSQYLALVTFARNLERQHGGAELWPRVTLTDEDCVELERRLTAVCPALRSEAFLPDWEYNGQHKLPIVPEPLGLVALQRSERRVDPVASMAGAVFIVLVAVTLLVLIVVRPPWVPGR